ncbi:MAG: hypothetical protein AVDCRST_MAG12-2179, partial [uncultured Rubrobacteraceae bacterium]
GRADGRTGAGGPRLRQGPSEGHGRQARILGAEALRGVVHLRGGAAGAGRREPAVLGAQDRGGGPGRRQRGPVAGVRRGVHAHAGERGTVEAGRPGVPDGAGSPACRALQARRRLLRRGRQPPRERGPVRGRGDDRRRGHRVLPRPADGRSGPLSL